MKISSKFVLLLLFITSSLLFVSSQTQVRDTDQESFTSIVISQTGLDFIKNLLITKAVSAIIPLQLPKIEKTVKIPFVGNVRMVLSNITIYRIDVLSSYVKPGESGVAIIASGTTCNLSMNWFYEYSTWLVPVDISDKGRASVQVVGYLNFILFSSLCCYEFDANVKLGIFFFYLMCLDETKSLVILHLMPIGDVGKRMLLK